MTGPLFWISRMGGGPTALGSLPPVQGHLLAWLHPDGKRAFTLAVHPHDDGSPDHWGVTHVHSGRLCGAQGFTMRTPDHAIEDRIAAALAHMDRIAATWGYPPMEAVFIGAEAHPPVAYPVTVKESTCT